MLSPVMLQRLRSWWRIAHRQGRMLPGGWLFPGLDPTDRLTARQLNRAVHAAADAAGIDKRISTHSLRHGFASRATLRFGSGAADNYNKPYSWIPGAATGRNSRLFFTLFFIIR
jgi:integrase